jgi:hypothetical protein
MQQLDTANTQRLLCILRQRSGVGF